MATARRRKKATQSQPPAQKSGRSAIRQALLTAGATAHYRDPTYYSAAYQSRDYDVQYYLALAEQTRGPILEYGCGNGRIALPIAKAGRPIVGVDLSAPMLADFKQRLRSEPAQVRQRVKLRRGDMRSLRLDQRFPLVLCTFNTLLHLYSRRDVERFFARVRAHMNRTGRFVFDVSVPDPEELHRDPNHPHRSPRFRHPSAGVVRYAERFDYDPLDQVLMVTMEFEPKQSPEQSWVTPLTHRQFFPQELESLLHYNGFKVVQRHGDFVEQPPDRYTGAIIYHCRRRG